MRNNDMLSLRGRRRGRKQHSDRIDVATDESDPQDELTDTGRQKALDGAVVDLQQAAIVMKEVVQDVSGVHMGQGPQASEESVDKKLLAHIMNCPAAKGYNQLKLVAAICTAVIGAFIGLFLYLAPGAFENAISKGVNTAMSKREPAIKQYIDEQIIITQHQMWRSQMGEPPAKSSHNSNAPWRLP